MNWYKIYGRHKKLRSEILYIGDVIARDKSAAMNKAKRRFPKWKVTSVNKMRKAVTKSDRIRFA